MNTKSKFLQIWIAVILVSLVILACGTTPVVVTQPPQVQPATPTPSEMSSPNPAVVTQPPQAEQATPDPSEKSSSSTTATSRSKLIKATVQIFGVHINSGKVVPIYVGSGSIISANGLILTNAHVANPAAVGETGETPDALVVGIVQSEDEPPVYAYRAEVKAIDGYMDLAVLQIVSTVKGDSIDPSSLNLTHVAVGNSDDVHVGDHINILGFPAIGGNTITYTSGDVSGFSAEDKLGNRAWIKTDATISGGNSGGMGTNNKGQLVGVPSIATSGSANAEATDCRVIQDTNGDGVIDNKDTCIPIGGFINGLRPVNLALPLIKAAESGLDYKSPYPQEQQAQPTQQGSGSEQIGDISWYTLDDQGNLGDPVTSYPSGTTGLQGVFKFSGFTDGEPFMVVWSSGGKKLYSGNYTWNQGSEGTTFVRLTNQGDPIPDGSYEVAIYVGDGQTPLAQSDVTVGASSGQPKPTGSGVQVSGTVTDKNTGNPVGGALVVVLNSGVNVAKWKADGYLKSDVLTYTQTDSNGDYVLPVKLARNMPYTFIISAKGYPTSSGDGLVWNDSEPADYTLNLTISQ